MPDLEDFLIKLEQDPVVALNEYNFKVDEESLDFVPGQIGIQDEYKQVDVTLVDEAQTIKLRAMTSGDSPRNSLRIWYLPWKRWDKVNQMSGVSEATLDNKGPGIFLTSQLTGCRFTIQYHSGDMTKATVLHLAGNYGENLKGAQARESVESEALTNVPTGGMLRRRYSIGRYSKNPKFFKLPVDGVRTYYDGEKATVLGVRGKDGKWKFFAQQYDRNDAFMKDQVKVL